MLICGQRMLLMKFSQLAVGVLKKFIIRLLGYANLVIGKCVVTWLWAKSGVYVIWYQLIEMNKNKNKEFTGNKEKQRARNSERQSEREKKMARKRESERDR